MAVQRKEGGQNIDTLDMRTLISWSLLEPCERPRTNAKFAEFYPKTDNEISLRRYRSYLFIEDSTRTLRKYKISRKTLVKPSGTGQWYFQ